MAPKQQNVPQSEAEVIDLSKIPAHVHSVSFDGVSMKTRDDLLIQVARDILMRKEDAVKSFEDLIIRSNMLRHQLQHSMNGCFKQVTVTIDSVPPNMRSIRRESGDVIDGEYEDKDFEHQYQVRVSVTEAQPVSGSVMSTTSAVSPTTPTIETALRFNNVAGRAESVSVAYSGVTTLSAAFGTPAETSPTPTGFTVSASKPLVHGFNPLAKVANHLTGKSDSEIRLHHDSQFKPMYPLLSATIFDAEADFPHSAFKQRERAFVLDHFSHWTSRVTSRIRFQTDWKSVLASNDVRTPIEIREKSGHYLKSSIKHTLTFDDRSYGWGLGNFSYFPCSGSLAEASLELAGLNVKGRKILPGNQTFVKPEVSVQINERIPGTRIIVQACAAAGLLLDPTGIRNSYSHDASTPAAVPLSEKFFVGGPLTVRGFSLSGVGPSVTSSSGDPDTALYQQHKFPLGADAYWSTGLHAYFPLPFIRRSRVSSTSNTTTTIASMIQKCVRLHAFANWAGTCSSGSTSELLRPGSLGNVWQQIRSNVRTSVGAGIVVAAGPLLRLELNYAIPLTYGQTDSPDPGFQFGFGVHFN